MKYIIYYLLSVDFKGNWSIVGEVKYCFVLLYWPMRCWTKSCDWFQQDIEYLQSSQDISRQGSHLRFLWTVEVIVGQHQELMPKSDWEFEIQTILSSITLQILCPVVTTWLTKTWITAYIIWALLELNNCHMQVWVAYYSQIIIIVTIVN